MTRAADSLEGARPVRRLRSDAKLRPEVTAAICKLVESGLTVRRAAERLHIHHSTIAEFRDRHPEFAQALAQAEAKFMQHQVENIQAAANKGSWQASAWLLERRFATEYSQPQIQIQNNVNLKQAPETAEAVMERLRNSPEAMRAIAGFAAAGLQLVVEEKVFDVETSVQRSPSEAESSLPAE